ncbi:MAG: adenosylmethionine--8-amino-7-oxononanoate transaminase [Bacteroidia bacterium]
MSISHRDLEYVWHPYTQMKDAEMPITITKGSGSLVFDETGKSYIDAISSWWVNTHGHAHPYVAQKLYEQFLKIEHVIFAGFTHEPAVELAERLLKILPGNLSKVFYSDNGSTAVEVALKMALQYHDNLNTCKNKIIAFKDAYHGDTFGAMSASARNVFTQAFQSKLFDVCFIPTPLLGNEEAALNALEDFLQSNQAAAFIFEPLVLGASGMLMYDEKVLDLMLQMCAQYQCITIADEVFTGFGRTGKMFATEHCNHKADIVCLSKGLTGGAMPLGVTACKQFIYDAFLSDDKRKTFFHGHSFTANPLACSAANASLDLFEIENTLEKIKIISELNYSFAQNLSSHSKVKDVRVKGTILAVEVSTAEKSDYLNEIKHFLFPYFLKHGIIVRPLGNIVYIVPPYCITQEELKHIYNTIINCLEEIT